MNAPPLKIGIVGVGIGRLHIGGYNRLPEDATVVALCDLNKTRLNETADQFDIPLRFTDYQEMFDSGAVEAVSICLPNSLHAPVSVAALEAGLHVLCEKPLAENAAAGQTVVDAATNSSGKFMMCFNRRYRSDVAWIKELLDKNELGRVYQIKAGWIRETGIPTGWFTNKEMAGGGPLIDLGVHMLEAVMWLLNYPTPLTVSGDVQTNFGPQGLKTWHWRGNASSSYTVEDSAVAFIRLAGNINFSLETSWASHDKPGQDDFFITIHGTEGTVKLYVANYAAENTVTLYKEINGTAVTIRPAIPGARIDHENAVAEFVRCLREDSPPTATAEQGQTIMQLIDAIYQSAEIGREVVLGD